MLLTPQLWTASTVVSSYKHVLMISENLRCIEMNKSPGYLPGSQSPNGIGVPMSTPHFRGSVAPSVIDRRIQAYRQQRANSAARSERLRNVGWLLPNVWMGSS